MIVVFTFSFGLIAIAVAVIPILIGMHLHATAESWIADSLPQGNPVVAKEHESLFDELAKKELEEWRQLVA